MNRLVAKICGYEDFDIHVAFSRTVANGDVCLCPKCNKESMDFNIDEANNYDL